MKALNVLLVFCAFAASGGEVDSLYHPRAVRFVDPGSERIIFHERSRSWHIVQRVGGRLRVVSPGGVAPSGWFPPSYTQITESADGFVFFGKTGRILHFGSDGETTQDALLFAGEIVALQTGTTRDSLVEAVVLAANGGSVYLARTTGGKWPAAPQRLEMRLPPGESLPFWRQVFLTLLVVFTAVSSWLYYRLRQTKRKIAQHRRELRERQNPVFTKADIPIGIADRDLLGFSVIEDAIVSVLKNPNTALPLSIVISGAWGSGKSSMMNRIRQKLDADTNRRFRTTWFNAWHFQGEKSLLDTFLISIVKFYEKTSFGLFSTFRVRLFTGKILRFSFPRQLLFWFAFSLIGLTLTLILYNFFGVKQPNGFIADCQNRVFNLARGELPWTGLSIYTKAVLGGLSILSVVLLRREFSPTGFLDLLNLEQFRVDAEKQTVGHKEKFKQDFWEIIAASDGSERVVVFIDDIDRIPGDKILELLEAINFISDIASAPRPEGFQGRRTARSNMVFVLGMATTEVARNLGSQLKKISAIQGDEERLGLNYIEKMVQLVVSVPYDEKNSDMSSLFQR